MENFSLDKFNLEHTECDFKREVEHKKTKSWLKSVSAFASGSGFRKILDAVKFAPNYTEENLPVFNSNPYSFSVTFKDMNYGVEPMAEENDRKTDLNVGVSSQKSSQKIIEMINQNPEITTQEMAENLGITRRAVAKSISKLQELNIIRRVGADKGGHWEVVSGAENK